MNSVARSVTPSTTNAGRWMTPTRRRLALRDTSVPRGSSPSSPRWATRQSGLVEASVALRWQADAAAAARVAEHSDVTLSSWDDYPVHQAAEFIAHPATSDRNFYDR